MNENVTEQTLCRRERERLAHRREILEAAERVFVRKGYHGATVEEIAHEADFAVGTLYNFFDGKEHMYAEVVKKLADEFFGVLGERVLSKQDPSEAIAALIELRLTHFEEHRGFFRVFFEAMPGSRLDPSRAFPDTIAPLYDRYIESVSSIFARGVRAGAFDRLDPLYLALCLEGVTNAFTAYWTRREPEEPLETRIAKMKQVFFERIRRRASVEEGEKPPKP